MSFSHLSDDELLVAIQRPDDEAAELLEPRFGSFLKDVARKRCRVLHLPADHVDDIVQEVYLRAIVPAMKPYDPARRSAQSYLGGLAFNAAKALKVTYRNRVDITMIDEDEIMDPMEQLVDQHAATLFDAVVTRELFTAVLRNESARVSRVVMQHYFDDTELQLLARDEGISTFKVSRDLRGFYARAAVKLRQPFFAKVAAHSREGGETDGRQEGQHR